MSKFKWAKLTEQDYGLLLSWWDDWGWDNCPTLDMLPANAYMVYTEEWKPLYAGFLYETGTSLGWVEYIVSNKFATPLEKRGALEYLIDVISITAKDKGIKSLFTSTISPQFVNSLKKCGFQVGDVCNTQLIKIL